MWADAQRDGRPAEYRWNRLQKFRNSIPCSMPHILADARCSSASTVLEYSNAVNKGERKTWT